MLDTAELVELIETLATALGRAETELSQLRELYFPVDLPEDVVKRLWQLDAFVAWMGTLEEPVREAYRGQYRAVLAKTRAPQASVETRVPVGEEALEELAGIHELLRRWTIRRPELREALRALLAEHGW